MFVQKRHFWTFFRVKKNVNLLRGYFKVLRRVYLSLQIEEYERREWEIDWIKTLNFKTFTSWWIDESFLGDAWPTNSWKPYFQKGSSSGSLTIVTSQQVAETANCCNTITPWWWNGALKLYSLENMEIMKTAHIKPLTITRILIQINKKKNYYIRSNLVK